MASRAFTGSGRHEAAPKRDGRRSVVAEGEGASNPRLHVRMADTDGTSRRPDPDAGPAGVDPTVHKRSRPEDRDGLREIGTDSDLLAPRVGIGRGGLAIARRLARWRPIEGDPG
jgi:hypothetical protein